MTECVSQLLMTGLERLEWNDTTRGRSFHSKLFVSILNFQSTEQWTWTENTPTDFCGGTVQLHPNTGVPSRGHRVLLTQRMTVHANTPQGKPRSRRCELSKSHLRGKSASYRHCGSTTTPDIYMTSVPQFGRKCIDRVSFATPSFPRTPPSQAMAVSRGSCRGRVPRRPHMLYHARYAKSCNFMYTHIHMVLQQISQHSQHKSTGHIRAPTGPSGLIWQVILFEHFFLFQYFHAGWKHWESIWYW